MLDACIQSQYLWYKMCIYPSLVASQCCCDRTATEMLAPTSCSLQGQHAGWQVHAYENVKVNNKNLNFCIKLKISQDQEQNINLPIISRHTIYAQMWLHLWSLTLYEKRDSFKHQHLVADNMNARIIPKWWHTKHRDNKQNCHVNKTLLTIT